MSRSSASPLRSRITRRSVVIALGFTALFLFGISRLLPAQLVPEIGRLIASATPIYLLLALAASAATRRRDAHLARDDVDMRPPGQQWLAIDIVRPGTALARYRSTVRASSSEQQVVSKKEANVVHVRPKCSSPPAHT